MKSWTQSQIHKSLNGQSALSPTNIRKNPSSSDLHHIENIGPAGVAFNQKSLQDCAPVSNDIKTMTVRRKSFNSVTLVNGTAASKLDHTSHSAKVASLSTANKGRSSVG